MCEYFASGRAGAPTPTQLVERTAPVSSKCDPLGSMLEESVHCAHNMHACPWDQVQMVAQNNAPSPFHASKETHREGHAQTRAFLVLFTLGAEVFRVKYISHPLQLKQIEPLA